MFHFQRSINNPVAKLIRETISLKKNLIWKNFDFFLNISSKALRAQIWLEQVQK